MLVPQTGCTGIATDSRQTFPYNFENQNRKMLLAHNSERAHDSTDFKKQ